MASNLILHLSGEVNPRDKVYTTKVVEALNNIYRVIIYRVVTMNRRISLSGLKASMKIRDHLPWIWMKVKCKTLIDHHGLKLLETSHQTIHQITCKTEGEAMSLCQRINRCIETSSIMTSCSHKGYQISSLRQNLLKLLGLHKIISQPRSLQNNLLLERTEDSVAQQMWPKWELH